MIQIGARLSRSVRDAKHRAKSPFSLVVQDDLTLVILDSNREGVGEQTDKAFGIVSAKATPEAQDKRAFGVFDYLKKCLLSPHTHPPFGFIQCNSDTAVGVERYRRPIFHRYGSNAADRRTVRRSLMRPSDPANDNCRGKTNSGNRSG